MSGRGRPALLSLRVKILIAGGTGLLGRALAGALSSAGHEIVVLTRHPGGGSGGAHARAIQWTPDGGIGPWAAEIATAGAVINLSGAGLADGRWSAARKALLRSSRVLPTRSLIAAIRESATRPAVYIQASGVGFYGANTDARTFDESFPPGDDFVGQLCVVWEAESQPVQALGCRLVILRSGVVLTRNGGILGRMAPPFRWFVGGAVAGGHQYLSWIHVDDWVRLVQWALDHGDVTGAYNATSPEPATNMAFSRALARAIRRPSWVRVPAFALRAVYGEMADVMLVRGQRVVPKRACEQGFHFQYPKLDDAMRNAARS